MVKLSDKELEIYDKNRSELLDYAQVMYGHNNLNATFEYLLLKISILENQIEELKNGKV